METKRMTKEEIQAEIAKHPDGYSSKHHTGKKCINGCGNPAGTAWSPYWCATCDIQRKNRISSNLKSIADDFKNGNI